VYDDDELSNEAQEKQLEQELDEIDMVQQVQASMSVPPGAAEMTPPSVRSNRLAFLSKLPLVSICKHILIFILFLFTIVFFANRSSLRNLKFVI
jgi:hypothetical protein